MNRFVRYVNQLLVNKLHNEIHHGVKTAIFLNSTASTVMGEARCKEEW